MRKEGGTDVAGGMWDWTLGRKGMKGGAGWGTLRAS